MENYILWNLGWNFNNRIYFLEIVDTVYSNIPVKLMGQIFDIYIYIFFFLFTGLYNKISIKLFYFLLHFTASE